MYMPKHFAVTDSVEIFKFVESNTFGQLISSVRGRPFATHMPFVLSDDNKKLIGHISQQNTQHTEIDGQQVLITLQGAHDYISPSWYSAPGVPTWNYQAVHIYGVCRVFSGPDELQGVIEALTHKYESSFPEPWVPKYKKAMLGAIVGLEITIDEVQCKYKLSQNRSIQDQELVAVELEKKGAMELAEAMCSSRLRQ